MFAAARSIELQSQRGQLDRDVRVEAVAGDRIEGSAIFRDRFLGLVDAGHVLAENVERRRASFGVERAHAADSILQRLAGDISRRDDAHERLRYERKRPDDQGVERIHFENRAVEINRSSSAASREARAKHQTSTVRAPEPRRRRAHSLAVAPEVARPQR